jgi:nucleoside-diphosphate-sugar epimerase
MKALVTGGAGFIGSHITEALVRGGHSVTVLDNFSLGSPDNLAWVRPGDAVEVITGDAGDSALLNRLVPGCDLVFHEAALPSVPRSVAEPVASHDHNLTATLRLLEVSRAAGVKRFVFASSSSIYGDNDAPVKHEALPPEPLSPYALQKYASETYARMFHRFHGLPTVSLRYFNVFGPRQSFDSPYSGVIARFCTLFLRGETPVIFGDGLQSRDFTFVANVVAANLAVAFAPESDVAGRVFNIACGESITLLNLAADLNALTGRNLTPRHEPARAGDIRHSKADISAARKAFGFAPTVSWKDGLRQTLDWYRERGT